MATVEELLDKASHESTPEILGEISFELSKQAKESDEAISALIKALSSPFFSTRAVATLALDLKNNKRTIELVTQQLNVNDKNQRKTAAEVLGNIKYLGRPVDTTVVEALGHFVLREPEEDICKLAANPEEFDIRAALANFLVQFLSDSNPTINQRAALVLGSISGYGRVILSGLLSDPNPQIHQLAERGLAEGKEPKFAIDIPNVRRVMLNPDDSTTHTLYDPEEDAIFSRIVHSPVMESSENLQEAVINLAQQLLQEGGSASKKVADLLEWEIDHKLQTLNPEGKIIATRFFLQIITDHQEDMEHKRKAVQGLKTLKPPTAEALPTLLEIFLDETQDVSIRVNVFTTLGQFNPTLIPNLAQLCFDTLANEENHEDLKITAIQVLASMRVTDKHFLESLKKILNNTDNTLKLRWEAMDALALLDTTYQPALDFAINQFDNLEKNNIYLLLRTLENFGPVAAKAVPILMQLFLNDTYNGLADSSIVKTLDKIDPIETKRWLDSLVQTSQDSMIVNRAVHGLNSLRIAKKLESREE